MGERSPNRGRSSNMPWWDLNRDVVILNYNPERLYGDPKSRLLTRADGSKCRATLVKVLTDFQEGERGLEASVGRDWRGGGSLRGFVAEETSEGKYTIYCFKCKLIPDSDLDKDQ